MAQRRVGDLAQRRFGVEGHPEPGGGQHVDVVGAVADGHGLLHRHPGLLSEVTQRLGLARTVDDRADHPAGELAVDDLQLVGRDEVHHQLVRQRLDHLPETTGDDSAVIAEPAQRAQRGPRPRCQLDLLGHLVEHPGRQPGQRGDPSVQGLGEVDLTAHRRFGHLRDRRLGPGVRGEHLDDLALDQRGVDVEHDQPLGPPRQAVVLDGDVDALGDGDAGQDRL